MGRRVVVHRRGVSLLRCRGASSRSTFIIRTRSRKRHLNNTDAPEQKTSGQKVLVPEWTRTDRVPKRCSGWCANAKKTAARRSWRRQLRVRASRPLAIPVACLRLLADRHRKPGWACSLLLRRSPDSVPGADRRFDRGDGRT